MKVYRQGDVIFIETKPDDIPVGTPIPTENGRNVFAYGEVTGHSHSALAIPELKWFGVTDRQYLDTREVVGDTEVVHEEHDTIKLPAGTVFEVRRQRFYTPEEIRTVLD